MPRLSVVLPVYNCRRYLAAAIASIQAQTFADFTLVIVDDGSTDGSAAIIDRLAAGDRRLRVIRRPNTGIVGALNDGLAGATGDLVARMDGDDLAEPGRFSAQLAYLDHNPDCIALGTAARIIDTGGAVVDLYRPPCDHDGIVAQLLRGNGAALLHPSVIFRRTALEAAGRYDPVFCRAEDLDLFLRLSHLGRFANLPEPLMRYRLHTKSTNFSQRAGQKALVQRIVTRERDQRGLPDLDTTVLAGPADRSPAQLARDWACSACLHGRATTALYYGLRALVFAPTSRESWRTWRYVLGRLSRRPPTVSSA